MRIHAGRRALWDDRTLFRSFQAKNLVRPQLEALDEMRWYQNFLICSPECELDVVEARKEPLIANCQIGQHRAFKDSHQTNFLLASSLILSRISIADDPIENFRSGLIGKRCTHRP
jgi:hypothetical protein